jgi:DMSO/TMAO reductase YedYZ heme-binding membrane subunit
MKRLLATILLLVLLSSFTLAGRGDNVGIDPVFEDIGIKKPTQWSQWNKAQKHTYLQNLGLYPDNGFNYQGKTPDLTNYFKKLNLEQPDNWFELSFQEKQSYINPPVINVDNVKGKNYEIPKTVLSIIALLIALLSLLKAKYKKDLSNVIFYVLPIILTAFSFMFIDKHFYLHLGSIAEKLLIFLLFVKPLSTIIKPLSRVVTYRKELGIASFWFFFFHAAGLIYVLSIINYTTPMLFWGLIAGIGMTILAITSNNYSIKKLKLNWKKLQYIVYPTFLLALAHSSLAENGNLNKFYIVGGIYLVLKIVEYVKKH